MVAPESAAQWGREKSHRIFRFDGEFSLYKVYGPVDAVADHRAAVSGVGVFCASL